MGITKVWKSGNSSVVTLDAEVLEKSNLKKGDLIEVVALGIGKVEVRKVNFKRVK